MCQPITHLLLFTREDTLKNCWLLMSLHVAVRLQLFEMSSITTPNQTILNICTRYNILRALFRKNIADFYRSATMIKFSTLIVCKRNRFDFWNSCKRLQNFVKVEALGTRHHQVPGSRSPVNTVMEKPHRPNYKEIKQHSWILGSKLKVHQRQNQDKCLYQHQVRPSPEYCASVWNPNKKELIHWNAFRTRSYIARCSI